MKPSSKLQDEWKNKDVNEKHKTCVPLKPVIMDDFNGLGYYSDQEGKQKRQKLRRQSFTDIKYFLHLDSDQEYLILDFGFWR